jgi:hypothetical protein
LKKRLEPEALIIRRRHKIETETKFLVYCVEIYKTAYKLTGKQVMQLFSQYGILEYIVNCYGALHTTGPEYIIEDIAGLIEERRLVKNS